MTTTKTLTNIDLPTAEDRAAVWALTSTTTLYRRLCETCSGAHQRPLEQADASPFCVGLACSHCDKVASDLYLANLAIEDAAREARHQRTLRRAGDVDEDEVNAIQSECLCDDSNGYVCTSCEFDGIAPPDDVGAWRDSKSEIVTVRAVCMKCGATRNPEGEPGWFFSRCGRAYCPQDAEELAS